MSIDFNFPEHFYRRNDICFKIMYVLEEHITDTYLLLIKIKLKILIFETLYYFMNSWVENCYCSDI